MDRSQFADYNKEQLISKIQMQDRLLNEAEAAKTKYKALMTEILAQKDETIAMLSFDKISNESFAPLSRKLNSLIEYEIAQSSYYLSFKKNPAPKEAQRVQQIGAELKVTATDLLQTRFQLNQILEMFPHAQRFLDEALESAPEIEEKENEKYLTRNEFLSLSSAERSDLVLSRFKGRNRSKAEIGRDFERYVGYLFEKSGYVVTYNGIINGLNDEGIDLICKQGEMTTLVQCKYWAKSKEIHEKHLAQLFGTGFVFSRENNCGNVGLQLWCSNQISARAKQFSDQLGIAVKQNVQLEDYPMIKCVDNDFGERIYHLPTDQQYDRIQMRSGRSYVSTAREAEDLGYRHAYKWFG